MEKNRTKSTHSFRKASSPGASSLGASSLGASSSGKHTFHKETTLQGSASPSFPSDASSPSAEWAVLAIESYLAAFALGNIAGLAATSILTLVLFFLCFHFIRLENRAEKEALLSPDKKSLLHSRSHSLRQRASLALGLLYTFLYLAGDWASLTGSLESRLFQALYLLLNGLGLFFLFSRCCRALLRLLGQRAARVEAIRPARETAPDLPFQIKFLLFFLLLACWLPWFLYQFPGVMTPDSLSQYSQAMGLTGYSNHHPVVHTLILKLFLTLGNALFHNPHAAIACCTGAQLLIMALILLRCLCVLYRRGAGKKLCFLFLLFYALIPYNALFAATLWKDVLFSGVMLLFVLSIYELQDLAEASTAAFAASLRQRPGLLVQFLLSGFLVCLLRSNGLYVFLAALPFLLWTFRRQWRICLPCAALILSAVFLVKGPVFRFLKVEQPAFSESLSIPAQQIARVVYEGRKLDPEQIDLLEQTVDYASIADYYQPWLSDPVKALIQYGNPEYLENHKGEYLKLWVQLGLQYPADYWNAFVDQTKGYWFPADPILLASEGISPNELGLSAQPILKGPVVWKTAEILSKLYTIFPLYGLLYSIGAFTWAAVFLFSNCLLNGNRKRWLLFVPFFALILTLCAATPVASDMRYAYPLVLAMPLLIYAGVEVKGREKSETEICSLSKRDAS